MHKSWYILFALMFAFLIITIPLLAEAEEDKEETYKIIGTVYDSRGHYLSGASIQISNTNLSYITISEKYGRYEITNVTPGDYVLKVKTTNQGNLTQNLTLKKNLILPIQMYYAPDAPKHTPFLWKLLASPIRKVNISTGGKGVLIGNGINNNTKVIDLVSITKPSSKTAWNVVLLLGIILFLVYLFINPSSFTLILSLIMMGAGAFNLGMVALLVGAPS